MTAHVLRVVAVLLTLMPSVIGPAWAHVFPDHSEPRVGHVLDAPPPAVRVWFDGAIEPAFSTLRVEDAGKRRVDRDDARVNGDASGGQPAPAARGPLSGLLERGRAGRPPHRGRFPFRVK